MTLSSIIIPEKYFKGLGSVPDWGMKYSNLLLLFEYSSKNNFEQARIVKTKVTKYQENIPLILEKFGGNEAIVLFVLDVSRDRANRFVERVDPGRDFYFTDYETFKSVPLGSQVQTPIYFWGEDGKEYPLTI